MAAADGTLEEKTSGDHAGRGSVKLTVHVDGGARGNPGPAAIAAVVSDENGEMIDERAR